MSQKLRNILLGVYLLTIIILLAAAGATRDVVVDVHRHDTYFVINGFVVFMPFAVLLSLQLIVHLAAQHLLRYPLLTVIHASGTILLIGVILATVAAGGLFASGVAAPRLINLSEHASRICTLLNMLLYLQLLLPAHIIASRLLKRPKRGRP